jgi:hypothetical protein
VAVREQGPRAAVLKAFNSIEERLAELLTSAGFDDVRRSQPVHMAVEAYASGMISNETLSAVAGLAKLRDSAAASPRDEISPESAAEFLTVANGVMIALAPKPVKGWQRPASQSDAGTSG